MHARQSDNGKAFVGYFFCRDMDSTTNTVLSILKGLIYGLGQEDRDLMRFLSDKFKSPEDIKGAGMDTLWGILTKTLNASACPGAVYLVIDALDECRDEGEVQGFVDLVRKESFRRCVKWVFTSRQSPQLRHSLGFATGLYTIDLDTSTEVEKSVDEYLDLVVGANQLLSEPLKQQVLALLKSGAEKTFLYVSLVLKDLRMTSGVDISRWLSDLKNSVHGESVYRRYKLMVQRVIENDNKSGTTTLQDLLKAVLLATKTLSLPELAIAAGLPSEFYDPDPESGGHRRVAELVQQCGHILRVTEGNVYLVHKSAKDYLSMGDGGDDGPFLSSSSAMDHSLIAVRSLRALGPALLPMPDLSTPSSLEDRGASRESLQRVKNLQYIYCHWTHHVARAQGKFTNWQLVERFFQDRLLAWVHVMGHLHKIQRCIDMVQELRAAIDSEPNPPTTSQNAKALLVDAFEFLGRYRPIIQAHPRQVYFLAKYFLPKASLTRKNYEHIPCCLRIANDAPAHWDPCKYTLDVSEHQWGEKDLRSVTAPRYERSGLDLLKGYSSYTSCDFRLGFSDNGETLFVGSSTLGRNALRWNVANGSFAGSFDATEDGLAHSNDGRLLASWSKKGIGVWDVGLGRLLCRLENSPSACLYKAVKFASDGSRILVWFEESSIMFWQAKQRLKIWDARDGCFLHEVDVSCDSPARDVNFVGDGDVLAVCLGRILLLHDLKKHKARNVVLGGIYEPSSAAFSDDGGILVIVTRFMVTFYTVDPLRELATWGVPQDNVGLNAYICQEQHSGSQKPNFGIEIAVSKDAKMAALSFRDSIAFFRLEGCRLFPTYHSTANFRRSIKDEDFFESKLPIIDALKFSPCGSYLACARNDNSISIWDTRASCRPSPSPPRPRVNLELVETGSSSRGNWAELPVYSPDGKICGAKLPGQVILWEVATASVKLQFYGTPSLGLNVLRNKEFIHLVQTFLGWAFSPDSRFAVTAICNTLHLVNTHTWTHTQAELAGGVVAMAFNCQSTHLALATSTQPPIVLLFDTAAGQCILRHEAGCESVHAMAFSSSGTFIAGGATSKKFFYYVWEEADFSSPSAFVTPRCLETPGYNTSEWGQIMRIEFSRDNTTAVSIMCHFGNNRYLGVEFSTHAEMITLGDSPTVGPRAKLVRDRVIDGTNHVDVMLQGRDEYETWSGWLKGSPDVDRTVEPRDEYATVRRWSRSSPDVDLAVSSRFGKRTGGMTVGGVDIRPPARHNNNTCRDVDIEKYGGFSWVIWRGKRIVCFPYRVLWVRVDLYEGCLMIAHEPGSVSFVSLLS